MNAAYLEYYHSLRTSTKNENTLEDLKSTANRSKRPGRLLISPDMVPTKSNEPQPISPMELSEPWLKTQEKSLVSPVSPPKSTMTLPYSSNSGVNYKQIRVNQPCGVLTKLMKREPVERWKKEVRAADARLPQGFKVSKRFYIY